MRDLHHHKRCVIGSFLARASTALLVVALSLSSPTRARAEAIPYAVARVMIYPGDTVTAAMIAEKPMGRAATGASREWATKEQAIGKVTRRTLLPSQPIALQALRMPDIVHSGKIVTLVYIAEGLVISAQGIAMQSGGAGSIVSVQSRESNVIVRGRVHSDATVRVEE